MSLNLFGQPIQSVKIGTLDRRFLLSPFSVLNARIGMWKRRKEQWKKLGIAGDAGRFDDSKKKFTNKAGDALAAGGVGGANGFVIASGLQKAYKKRGDVDGRGTNYRAKMRGTESPKQLAGTSIFDPVLCELMYRWFCPRGGRILDPFCGGSTAGIVASTLGYRFTGIDTRQEQIDANYPQAERLNLDVEWLCGDSREIDKLIPEKRKFDFLWTDPPYFDLEVYGGKNDGSMIQTFEEFLVWYESVLAACIARVRKNRFVGLKIGEIRDKKGVYRNFVGETIRILNGLGLHYYNEIILLTPAGSLPIRAGGQFQASRKIGKTHQNVLIFIKGDPKKVRDVFADMPIRND